MARLDGNELARPGRASGGGTRQSRLTSLMKALANIAVGYEVAVLTQVFVFTLCGLQASLAQNLGIGAAFTAVSIVRSYALRCTFERLRQSRAGAVNGP